MSGKFRSNVAFHHLYGILQLQKNLLQSVLQKEIVIEPKIKLEYVPEFCFFDDTFGGKGGV